MTEDSFKSEDALLLIARSTNCCVSAYLWDKETGQGARPIEEKLGTPPLSPLSALVPLVPLVPLVQDCAILLLARDQQTYRHLSRQFQQRRVHKVYLKCRNSSER